MILTAEVLRLISIHGRFSNIRGVFFFLLSFTQDNNTASTSWNSS